MKATDIMIGDYLGCDASPWVKVESIAEDGIIFADEISEGACSFDHLFGLPLTPETLERFGFEKHLPGGGEIDMWMSYGEEGDGDILVEFKNYSIHTKIDGPTYMTTWEIKYVHELQHALRLCGTGKEMIL